MSVVPTARIVSTGRYLPDRVLTNADLERMVDTSNEWIVERTGILERRLASDEITPVDMGERAALAALEKAGAAPGDVDALIVTTATPNHWLPSTSCELQSRIGASRQSMAFDIHAACSGFLYALSTAEGYLAAGRVETVLIVATEKMSSIVDWDDRGTCILFGDGAGAAVVQRAENGRGNGAGQDRPGGQSLLANRGILSSYHRADGDMASLLQRSAGGSAEPLDEEAVRNKEHLLRMSGREVFKSAVKSMAAAGTWVLDDAGMTSDDVDLMVPHQANIRIIESTARYSGIPMEKVFVNLHRYGNISSATIPVALDEAAEEGRIGPGSVVLTTAFGAGLTWGAMVLRW